MNDLSDDLVLLKQLANDFLPTGTTITKFETIVETKGDENFNCISIECDFTCGLGTEKAANHIEIDKISLDHSESLQDQIVIYLLEIGIITKRIAKCRAAYIADINND